ncbi:unnamed protein product [Leptidea sinapis]|uniref:Uncharacterized protein n=1 Tax=Leptidea sinapis TaxID=189913 RepID=A0A5E4QEW7_9NEOP|nr:unnamed protein product [Leptidea sinapis]
MSYRDSLYGVPQSSVLGSIATYRSRPSESVSFTPTPDVNEVYPGLFVGDAANDTRRWIPTTCTTATAQDSATRASSSWTCRPQTSLDTSTLRPTLSTTAYREVDEY